MEFSLFSGKFVKALLRNDQYIIISFQVSTWGAKVSRVNIDFSFVYAKKIDVIKEFLSCNLFCIGH